MNTDISPVPSVFKLAMVSDACRIVDVNITRPGTGSQSQVVDLLCRFRMFKTTINGWRPGKVQHRQGSGKLTYTFLLPYQRISNYTSCHSSPQNYYCYQDIDDGVLVKTCH